MWTNLQSVGRFCLIVAVATHINNRAFSCKVRRQTPAMKTRQVGFGGRNLMSTNLTKIIFFFCKTAVSLSVFHLPSFSIISYIISPAFGFNKNRFIPPTFFNFPDNLFHRALSLVVKSLFAKRALNRLFS